MKYCLLEDEFITNVIEAEEDFAIAVGAKPYYIGNEIGLRYRTPCENDIDNMIISQEYRITLLELGVI